MNRLDGHIAAVQRKLALGLFLDCLAWGGAGVAAAVLVGILVFKTTGVRIPIPAFWGVLGLAIAASMVLAVLRRPDRKAVAVAIDERLALKERFSTALYVRGSTDAFAQAALHDALTIANKVQLVGKFPLEFPRGGYFSIVGAVLAVLALLLPQMDLLGRQARRLRYQEQQRQLAQTKDEIKQAIARVEAVPKAIANSQEVKLAKAELEALLQNPPSDPAVSARRQMEAMSKVEEAMKEQIKQAQDFAQTQRTLTGKFMDVPPEEQGPAADAQRNIMKGNYDAAVKDLSKTAEQFKQMSAEEKKKTAEQMKRMADQLNAMANDPRAAQKLAEQLQQAGVNKDQVKQAQDLMKRAAGGDQQAQQQLSQMQKQVMDQLKASGMNPGQCQAMQQAMQQAQQAAAAQAKAGQMAQGASQMAQGMNQAAQGQGGQQMAAGQQQMADALSQMQAMQQDFAQTQQAMDQLNQQMAQAGGQCNGQGQGQGQQPGMGEWDAGDPNRQGPGQGRAGIGQGGQGQKTVAPFGVKTERSPSQHNDSGQTLASVFVKDKSVKGESKLQLREILKAGNADEGDDVDDTRADRRAQEVQRKYFQVWKDDLDK